MLGFMVVGNIISSSRPSSNDRGVQYTTRRRSMTDFSVPDDYIYCCLHTIENKIKENIPQTMKILLFHLMMRRVTAQM